MRSKLPPVSGTRAVPGHPGVYRYEVKKGPASKRTRYAIVASVGIKQKWLRGFLTIHAAEEALDALKTDLRKGSTGSEPAIMGDAAKATVPWLVWWEV